MTSEASRTLKNLRGIVVFKIARDVNSHPGGRRDATLKKNALRHGHLTTRPRTPPEKVGLMMVVMAVWVVMIVVAMAEIMKEGSRWAGSTLPGE